MMCEPDVEAPAFQIPGGWARRCVQLDQTRLQVWVPADPDGPLEAQVAAAESGSGPGGREVTDPFWAALWSAATPLAELVCRHAWSGHETVLELGCGVGLVGLAALSQGLHVTFSDHVPEAIQVALVNARANGFSRAQAQLLDWNDPPAGQYSLILASDVVYDRAVHAALLATVDRLLTPDGECWIGDPGRVAADDFLAAASVRFRIARRDRQGAPLGDPQVGRFQLFGLRRHPV